MRSRNVLGPMLAIMLAGRKELARFQAAHAEALGMDEFVDPAWFELDAGLKRQERPALPTAAPAD